MGKSRPPKVHRYSMHFKATAVRLTELPDILIQDVAEALDNASALRNPFGHFRIGEEFRRVLFRKFPYTLIYLPSPDELLVVSFFHQHREPGVWLERFSS